jgi:transposase
MDNASFHKSDKTQHIIEQNGHRLLFLPAYSPDLNPIEQYWAHLKLKSKNVFQIILICILVLNLFLSLFEN